MIYKGALIPFVEGGSRVSYAPTPLICANVGCGARLIEVLTSLRCSPCRGI